MTAHGWPELAHIECQRTITNLRDGMDKLLDQVNDLKRPATPRFDPALKEAVVAEQKKRRKRRKFSGFDIVLFTIVGVIVGALATMLILWNAGVLWL